MYVDSWILPLYQLVGEIQHNGINNQPMNYICFFLSTFTGELLSSSIEDIAIVSIVPFNRVGGIVYLHKGFQR